MIGIEPKCAHNGGTVRVLALSHFQLQSPDRDRINRLLVSASPDAKAARACRLWRHQVSGAVNVSAGVRWSAASWLFDWALKDIAQGTGDVELAGHVTGVVDEQLGWFGLDDIAPGQRREIRRIITERLADDAEREFPADLPGRPEALALLKNLAAIVSDGADH